MRLLTDDRGVTVQIGTVLLFAVLIVLVSIYQASVVPQQNEEVEFNHNQQVQGEMQDLRDELRRTAVTGSGGSSSVALGTRFPVRAFFVNPPPPSGRLETTAAVNVTVRNATADGETGDYWTGDARNFSTRGLVYEPNYQVYGNPPTTVYRSGVLYNRFAGGNRTLGGQRLVDGNAISLVAVNGSYAKAGSGTATVDLRPVSPAVRTVTVANETANVSVVVPTDRPVDEWAELLADEMNESEGDERYVLAVEEVSDRDAVRVVLEPATYELRLAKVGVGTDVTPVGQHYVTDVRGDNVSVAENSDRELIVEIRDRYNNPVSGETLNVTLVSGLGGDAVAAQGQSGDELTNLTTDAEGRVSLVYDAPEDFDGENEPVGVRVGTRSVPDDGGSFAPSARANLSFNLTAVNADGSGLGGGGGGGGGADTYDVNWTAATGTGLDCDAEFTFCTLNANEGTSVDLTATVTEDGHNVSQAIVDYAVNNSSLGSVAPADGTADNSGTDGTTLDVAETNGTITAYAASGDDVAEIAVNVSDPPSDPGPGPSPDPALNWSVIDDTDVNANEPRYNVSYNVSNPWPSYDGVEVEFRNLDDEQLTETISANETLGTVEYSAGHGQDNTYNVTIRALAANGSVLAERSLVDDADGDDPGGDDDLGSPSSPELAGRWITDASDETDGAVYNASYNVTNRDEFDYVEVQFQNLGDGSATETNVSNSPRGRVSYEPGYGDGQEYEIAFRVYDENGVLVDDLAVSDPADGDEPAGNELLPNATSPTLENVDVDDVSDPWNSQFEVDYSVSDGSGTFDSVEVEYKNLDTGETVETDVERTPSGQVQLDTYQPNGDEFEITVRVYDESNAIVDAETVTETGNETNDGSA